MDSEAPDNLDRNGLSDLVVGRVRGTSDGVGGITEGHGPWLNLEAAGAEAASLGGFHAR